MEELTEGVREILLHDWDPIGIADHPLAHDEYDSYAPKIAGMLWHGHDLYKIADHLHKIATTAMGLPGNIANEKLVAAKLLLLISERKEET